MKLPLLLLILILTITLIVPTILPAWPRENSVSEGGYLEELAKGFGVKHRMKPQLSAGGQIMPIPAPSGLDVLTNYTGWVGHGHHTVDIAVIQATAAGRK